MPSQPTIVGEGRQSARGQSIAATEAKIYLTWVTEGVE